MNFTILHEDPDLVAIHKPAGFHVHPPEDGSFIPDGINTLRLLKAQTGRYLYPVHRLDRGTSGVLVFALSPDAARGLKESFDAGRVAKTYYAVVRGWTPEEGRIDAPLQEKSARRPRPAEGAAEPPMRTPPPSDAPAQALTLYARLATLELPVALGPHPTSRYSLLRVSPRTGRWHQIRRHLARENHPIVGDTRHGDRVHNRYFQSELRMGSLLLTAHAIVFPHPATGRVMRVTAPWRDLWHRTFDLFGLCPWGDGKPGARILSEENP